MALPDAQAAASAVFSAAFLNGHSVFKRRSIGDNRSTIPAAGSSMVEPLSSMALPDAQAAGSSMVEPLSPMALPDAQAAGSLVFSAMGTF